MSLVVLGQSGGPTSLSANDDVFGLMTQVPEGAVKHDEAGLLDADGSTAFGATFKILARFGATPSVSLQTTNVDFCTDDAPYKFRVLGVKTRCIDNHGARDLPGMNYCKVSVQKNDGSDNYTDIVPQFHVEDMVPGDARVPDVIHQVDAEVDENKGLRCTMQVKGSGVTVSAVSFMVEIECLRVV